MFYFGIFGSVDNITRSLQTNTILETKDTCCTKTCSEMLQENMTLSLYVKKIQSIIQIVWVEIVDI